jgi:D-glycero-alpha-D-manno-heptose-7-phosphate kinase
VPESTLSLDVQSEMPPGASTGTSAAVAVAVIAALLKCRGEVVTAAELARAAHCVETARLGLQAGIQDQIAAAYGGINFIEVIGYPEAIVTQLTPAADVLRRLEDRLLLVYLGRAHRSSDVHDAVISRLHDAGGSSVALDRLHDAAVAARDALVAADLPAFGRALRGTVDQQAALHPSVVSTDARLVGALADASGALGWKVNGAGGDGGSVSVLLGEDPSARAAFSLRLIRALPAARIVPIRLARVGAAAPLV